MKRILALVLILCLAVSLAACGSGGEDNVKDNGGGAPVSDGGDGDGGGSEKSVPSKIGFFDKDFDYSQYPTYRVVFVNALNDALTVEFDRAYEIWAKQMNIDYTNLWCPVSGSVDELLSGLQTYCDQGYDGIIVSPDVTVYTRVKEILDDNGVAWFPHLGQARDYTGDGRLLAPSSGYDQKKNGQQTALKLLEWKDTTFPDVPWDEVGYICCTWSIAPEVHMRAYEQEKIWAERFPEFGEYDELMTVNPKNFFIADAASGNSDQATCQDLTTQIISSNANIKYWLIGAAVDYYAVGCTNAVENLNMGDTCCVVSVGGTTLREQFDSGVENCWRYAYISSASLFTECPIAALWAMMAGLATHETLYPEWVNPNDKGDIFDDDGNLIEEHNYAQVLLRSEWIDKSNYKAYLEWSDLYQFGEGADGFYDYEPVTDVDMFQLLDDLPEWDQ